MISVLIFTSITYVGMVQAELSIPKPSIPELTVNLVDTSYDEPTAYSVDPYTGEQLTDAGMHVERTSLRVTIKNQPFTVKGEAEGASFFYNIRVKGSFSEEWTELYRASDGYPTQSDSESTVISLGTLRKDGLSLESGTVAMNIPLGGQVDFQVEAMVGWVSRVYNPDATNQIEMYPWRFTGEKSGWSNTQTLIIDVNSVKESEQSTGKPNETSVLNQQLDAQSAVTQPGIDWTQISLLAALGVIVALLALIALVHRNKKRGSKSDLLSTK